MLYISILNWKKHNPRKDVKATSWLRLENSFWLDQKFFKFNNNERMVWISLLSIASSEQRDQIEIDPEMIASVLRITPKLVEGTVEKLKEMGRISLDVTPALRARIATDGRTDVTDEQTDGRTDDNTPTQNQIDYAEYAETWNRFAEANQLSKIRGITDKRKAKIKKRIADKLTVDKFKELLVMASRQPFLLGQNDRGWTFDFDWVMENNDNGLKILEGKYLNSARGGSSNAAAVRQAIANL